MNKLGDPSQKVASKAVYCLTQLLRHHPNMKGVVLLEVEKLLFRPNVSTKAQYYGVCYLSQFYLSHDSTDVAKRLIDVYFSFFKACIKKVNIFLGILCSTLGIKNLYIIYLYIIYVYLLFITFVKENSLLLVTVCY